jgi:hypothetical protein
VSHRQRDRAGLLLRHRRRQRAIAVDTRAQATSGDTINWCPTGASGISIGKRLPGACCRVCHRSRNR